MNTVHSLSVALLSLAMLLAAVGGSGADANGHVPITTSSPDALQLYLKARDLQDRLQAQESLPYLQQAIENDPGFAAAYLLAAGAQPTNVGFFEYLNKAVALADQASEGERLQILAADAGAKGQPMKQQEYLLKLVALFPNDERAHNLLGLHYLTQQNWEKVRDESQRATELNPVFSTPYNQLGYAFRYLGDYESAEKAFVKYMELIPGDPNPYDSYAELLMKMGRFDESIAMYRKALEQNPHFVASFTGIALNQNLKGNYAAARQELQRLYETARTDNERRAALFNMASSFLFEGQPEAALGKIEEQYEIAAKNQDPGNMSGDLLAMATIYVETGRADDAQAKVDQALKTVMDSGLAPGVKDNARRIHLFQQARVALLRGDVETARASCAAFTKAVAEVNSSFQVKLAHQLAGMIALATKEWDGAIAELGQAGFEYNPDNYYRLAVAYHGKGDTATAREYCLKAAHFNGLDGLNVSTYHNKALKMLEELR